MFRSYNISYLLMTVIGCSVSMFFANNTKLRILETVRQSIGDKLTTGSTRSTKPTVSPICKLFCWHLWFMRIYIFLKYILTYKKLLWINKIKFIINSMLTLSLVIWTFRHFISVVCSSCSWIVKGATTFELLAPGNHSSACKDRKMSLHPLHFSVCFKTLWDEWLVLSTLIKVWHVIVHFE